jgi:hypothetical protein
MKTYDAKRVAIVINNIIVTGFGDGDFVAVERNEDTYALQMGTDGEGTRSKTNNKSGRITITTMQGSVANLALSGFGLIDEKSSAGAVKIEVKDLNFLSSYTANQAWLVKPPAATFGREAGGREWVFETDNLEWFEGGLGIGSIT